MVSSRIDASLDSRGVFSDIQQLPPLFPLLGGEG